MAHVRPLSFDPVSLDEFSRVSAARLGIRFLNIGQEATQNVAIVSGAITAAGSNVKITGGGTLNTINGGAEGDLLFLHADISGATIVDTGNIRLTNTPFVIGGITDNLLVLKHSTILGSKWIEVGRFALPTADPMTETVIVSSANQTANNTQNQDHPQFLMSVTANSAYALTLQGRFSGNDTMGDVAVNIAAQNGASINTSASWASSVAFSQNGAIANNSPATAASTTAMFSGSGQVVNNGDGVARPVRLEANISTTASGILRVQFGVNNTGAGRTATLHANAVFRHRRIG